MRWKYVYPSERVKYEEIRIAGDKVCRPAAHAKLEELIVLWVSTGVYSYRDVDPFDFPGERSQKIPHILLIDVLAKLFPAQDVVKLSENCVGSEHLPSAECVIQGAAGFGFGQKQRANQHVGIEDATQLCAFQKRIQYFRRESAGFGLTGSLIEHLPKGWITADCQLAKPKTQQNLHPTLLFGGRGVISASRLRIQRNGYRVGHRSILGHILR